MLEVIENIKKQAAMAKVQEQAQQHSATQWMSLAHQVVIHWRMIGQAF
jgi:hypothetical protein